jgi:hypothetical protein
VKIFLLKNRLEPHLSGNFQTLFGCKTLSIDPKLFSAFEILGAEIQNGAQKRKNLMRW